MGAESCDAAPGALCVMVCVDGVQWSYRYTWRSEPLADQDPRRPHSYVDPRRPELYWFMVCKPNCELNAAGHASFQLEEVATARSYGDLEVRRVVIKLGRAWTAYYATC